MALQLLQLFTLMPSAQDGMEWHTPMCYTDSVKGCRRRLFFVQAGRHETSCLRFSLLGQASACKKWLLVGTRLRPEWRQGIRKDRAANPVFSDITFKRRGGRLLPAAAEPLPPPSGREAGEPPSPSALLPPPSGREAQSLRRCAPPPFTQGRHGGRPLRRGFAAPPLPEGEARRGSGIFPAGAAVSPRINFQAGGGCGVLRTSDRPAEGFLRRISH